MPEERPPERGRTAPLPVVLDLTRLAADFGTVRVTLDSLARDLRTLWSGALVEGDFATIDRLVAASHAIHGAAVALTEDSVVPSTTHPVRANPPVANHRSTATPVGARCDAPPREPVGWLGLAVTPPHGRLHAPSEAAGAES